MRRVDIFHRSCLCKICNIVWPNKISNKVLYQKTGSIHISLEIKKRRLWWLGHVLRMPGERIPKAVSWEGKERQTKEHLAKDSDGGTEGEGSLLGRSTGQSTRQGSAAVYNRDLRPSRDEEDKKVSIYCLRGWKHRWLTIPKKMQKAM